jgi:hypothetical protein
MYVNKKKIHKNVRELHGKTLYILIGRDARVAIRIEIFRNFR